MFICFDEKASPVTSVDEIFKRHNPQNVSLRCEYKYDGERAQIHKFGNEVKIFSRNCLDSSEKYKDVVEHIKRCIPFDFIIDSEIVAVSKDTQRPLPFQELTKRCKKNVCVSDISIYVQVYMFDVLWIKGESCLDLPLAQRVAKLENFFDEDFYIGEDTFYLNIPTVMNLTKSDDTSASVNVQKFLTKAVNESHEGLMIKVLDSKYDCVRRSTNWLKLKKDYVNGDSLDLVIIGANHGAGKRKDVYGSFFVASAAAAAADLSHGANEDKRFQVVCKVGTGFSDAMLEQLSKELKKVTPTYEKKGTSYYQANSEFIAVEYDNFEKPDQFFEPSLVVEIKFADLTISNYPCAHELLNDNGSGISLRFPRFVRVRDDKNLGQITSAQEIFDMYQRQSQGQSDKNISKRKSEDETTTNEKEPETKRQRK